MDIRPPRVAPYPHAPISEAVLDVQVRTATPPSQDVFIELARSLAADYPQSGDVKLNSLQVNVLLGESAPAPLVAHSSKVFGLRLSRSQNDRVLLVQPRGMKFSHLAPYTSWEIFQPEARRLWQRYVEYVQPVAVTRVALRYINRIEIPKRAFDTSVHFNFYPEIPKNIPQDMSGFFVQVQMPQTDLAPDIMAVINFTPAPPPSPDLQVMVLDINVFAERTLAPSTHEVFEMLELMRARKNRIFEACITDETRKLFE